MKWFSDKDTSFTVTVHALQYESLESGQQWTSEKEGEEVIFVVLYFLIVEH